MTILNQFGQPYQPEVATRDLVEGLIQLSDLLPHPSKILRDTGKTIAVFEETLKQPDVAAASRSFHDGIKHLDWDIIHDNHSRRAKLLRSILRDMNLKEICSNAASAREFGYTIFETKKVKVGNLILIEDLIEKPREWFKFDYQNRLRLITKSNPDGILVDEAYPNQFILVQHEPTYKNPYGHALLDEVYWLAEGLKGNFEWHLQFLEDDGRDHWLAYVPQTASQDYITKVQLALASLRRRSVAVLFDGVRAEQRENKGRKSSSDAFVQFEKLAVSKINKLFLGSDLSMQLDGTGSYAASKTGYKIRGEALSSGIALAETAINRALNIIQTLSALPDTDTNPRFTLFPPIETDKEQAEIDKLYAEASGSKLSPKLLTKRGYDPDDFITQPEPQTFEASDDLDALLNAVDGLKKKSSPPNPNSTSHLTMTLSAPSPPP